MSEQFSSLKYFSEDKTSIGAECQNCGRVLKLYKSDLKETDSEFVVNRIVLCQCGRQYSRIEYDRSERNSTSGMNLGKAPAEKDVVRCPRCSSTQITGFKKGFGLGKAVGGGVLLGPLGLLGGFIGSKKVVITCLKCGHQWKP